MKNIDNRIANALGRAGENIEMLTVDSTGKDLYQKAANGDLVRVNDMTEKEVEKIVEKVVEREVTKTVYVDKIVTQTIKTYDPSYLSNVIVGNASSPEGTINNPVGNRVYLDQNETSPAQNYSDLIAGKSAKTWRSLLAILRGVSNNRHTVILKNNYLEIPDSFNTSFDSYVNDMTIDSAVGSLWITSNKSISSSTSVNKNNLFSLGVKGFANSNDYTNSTKGFLSILRISGTSTVTLAGVIIEGSYSLTNSIINSQNNNLYSPVVYSLSSNNKCYVSAPSAILLGSYATINSSMKSVSSAGKLVIAPYSDSNLYGFKNMVNRIRLINSVLSDVTVSINLSSASPAASALVSLESGNLFILENTGIGLLSINNNIIDTSFLPIKTNTGNPVIAGTFSATNTESSKIGSFISGRNILIETFKVLGNFTSNGYWTSYSGTSTSTNLIYSETAGSLFFKNFTAYPSKYSGTPVQFTSSKTSINVG